MKNVIKLVLVVAITIVISSCGETANKKQESTTKKETVKTTVESHKSDSKVQLDNGKLWLANIETTQGIINMKKLLDSFTDKESITAYASLKSNLEKEFGTIITECTMKGEPHNQLHNYLIPIKDVFDGLDSSDLNICKENFEILKTHLEAYSTYFK
ncbi:hypothetical protein KAH94_05780 [bacterium]|nr:hypothetical protein [bacterium]